MLIVELNCNELLQKPLTRENESYNGYIKKKKKGSNPKGFKSND